MPQRAVLVGECVERRLRRGGELGGVGTGGQRNNQRQREHLQLSEHEGEGRVRPPRGASVARVCGAPAPGESAVLEASGLIACESDSSIVKPAQTIQRLDRDLEKRQVDKAVVVHFDYQRRGGRSMMVS